MATHDYNIANQGFPAFRTDLNNALAAIVSNNSNATAPATTFAHMLWVDTSANPSILKMRNADNDAWITLFSLDQTADKLTQIDIDNLRLDANTISSTDTNGNIVLAPNGSGDVHVDADTLRVGDSGSDATVQSNGNADLILKTGNATTGSVTLADGADGNLTVALNGTGQVIVNAGAVGTPTIAPTGDLNTGIYFPAADNIGFATNGVIRGRWTNDGLCFNADTAATNALDDYEEGTFSPNIGGNATYTHQVGRYVKIGKIVHCTFDFLVNVIGTGSPNNLSGFPFTSVNIDKPQTGACSYFQDINTSVIFVGCYIQNNSTTVVFVAGGASGATIAYNAFSIFKNSARIIGQITYEVA